MINHGTHGEIALTRAFMSFHEFSSGFTVKYCYFSDAEMVDYVEEEPVVVELANTDNLFGRHKFYAIRMDESEIQIPPEGYEIVSNPGNPQSPRPGPSSAKDY